MKKILMLLAFVATVILSANAQEPQAPAKPAKVPAYRGIIERTQPNGYILRTFLRGDERKHFAATEDGWQIKEDKKGWLRYAKMNRKGDVVISNRKAHNIADRSKCEQRWLQKHGIQKKL